MEKLASWKGYQIPEADLVARRRVLAGAPPSCWAMRMDLVAEPYRSGKLPVGLVEAQSPVRVRRKKVEQR